MSNRLSPFLAIMMILGFAFTVRQNSATKNPAFSASVKAQRVANRHSRASARSFCSTVAMSLAYASMVDLLLLGLLQLRGEQVKRPVLHLVSPCCLDSLKVPAVLQ